MSRRGAAINTLGSKRLSVWLLISLASYALFLAALWAFSLTPPAFYMVWAPLAAWAVIFSANLLISLFTNKYAFKGNLVFHAAFLVVAAGIATSLLYRFTGEALLFEGDTFFGEKKEYLAYSPLDSFESLAPDISFKLDRIVPEYWNNELYFVRLDGEIRHQAETLENKAVLTLNDGIRMNGARLRIASFGIFPEITLTEKGNLVLRGTIRATVFPPGMEDAVDIKGYRIFIKMLTDPELAKGALVNKSMNLKEPVFIVKVVWLGNGIFSGALRRGEALKFGDFSLTFTGAKYWIVAGVVKDPGENVVFAGIAIGVIGLLLRAYHPLKGYVCKG